MGKILADEAIKELKPVVVVSVAYALLLFSFCMNQTFTKIFIYKKLKEDNAEDKKLTLRDVKYRSTDKRCLKADRTFLNMLEQCPFFLLGLWLHAAVVDIDSAALAGWVYVVTRVLYPFVFDMGLPYLWFSTFPNYWVLAFYYGRIVIACLA